MTFSPAIRIARALKTLWIISSLALLAVTAPAQTPGEPSEKLLLLQEMTRHGPRYPMQNFSNITHLAEADLGELTPAGLRSHYILGKNIQATYPEFFDHYFNANEIEVRSTGWNRTIMSAIAHLEGIFDQFSEKPLDIPQTDWRLLPDSYTNAAAFDVTKLDFPTALPQKYYPFPVHTVPTQNSIDWLLMAKNSCMSKEHSRLTAAAERTANGRVKDTLFYSKTLAEMQKRFDISEEKMGGLQPSKSNGFMPFYSNVYLMADYYMSITLTNPKGPLDIVSSKSDWLLFVKMKILYYMTMLDYTNDYKLAQVCATPILKRLRDNIAAKINADQNPNSDAKKYDLKYLYLSAHDSTIMELFSGSKFQDPECFFQFVENYTPERDDPRL